jgi:diguanylate cyclase (GGDEF)-like protein/PAS domain S-box-containing protein
MADASTESPYLRSGDRHPLRRAGERRGTPQWGRGPLSEISRRAALRSVKLLDTPSEERFDRLAGVAATSLSAPVALITLVDEDRQFCKSAVGLPQDWLRDSGSAGANSFCRHTVALGEPLAIEDARRHPLVKSHPATTRGIVSYLGVPLLVHGRHVLGTLSVLGFEPRRWTAEDVRTLSDLASVVAQIIELRAAVVDAEQKAMAAETVQNALLEGEERFRTAFELAPIGMGLVTPQGRWREVNEALCNLFGYTRDEMVERALFELTHPVAASNDRIPLDPMSVHVGRYQMDRRCIHRSGREFWVQLSASPVAGEGGEPIYYIVQMQDLTTRKSEEERLRTLSLEDELTGLYNRRAFLAMAGEQFKLARRQDRALVLLFADIDRMKWINDTFGHLEGDRAIRRVASVLKNTFRESDLVARMGGDEFAILAADVPENDLSILIQRLTEQIERVNSDDAKHAYPLSISLGSALFDAAGTTSIEEMIALADARMYMEKGARSD